MRLNVRELAESEDQKRLIMAKVNAPPNDIEVFGNRVLCVTYIEPEKTRGGIFLPDKKVEEARYQGKVGLVIKVGPTAFVDDATTKFGGVRIGVGDWVYYRVADGLEMGYRGMSCRVLPDVLIIGRVTGPEAVW